MPVPASRGGIDYPDFETPGLPHSKQIAINLSELAVRLGSPLVYEQWGNLLYSGQFLTGPEIFIFSTLGASATAFLSATRPYKGPYCVKLGNDGTGGNLSTCRAHFAWGYLTRAGAEIAFRTESDVNEFQLRLILEVDSIRRMGEILFDGVESTISYLGQDGAQHEIVDLGVAGKFVGDWRLCKLSCDFVTSEYVKLLYGGNEYSLSGIALNEPAFTGVDEISVQMRLTGGSGSAEDLWLDNINLTVNEP